MVIAVIAVWMVQPSINEIIDVVAMRDGLMAAAGTVAMCRLMSASAVLWCTAIRIRCCHADHMFVNAPIADMMKMPIVEVIGMAFMSNRGMAAARGVHVGMLRGGHNLILC